MIAKGITVYIQGVGLQLLRVWPVRGFGSLEVHVVYCVCVCVCVRM
jgi:hypothetical protein